MCLRAKLNIRHKGANLTEKCWLGFQFQDTGTLRVLHTKLTVLTGVLCTVESVGHLYLSISGFESASDSVDERDNSGWMFRETEVWKKASEGNQKETHWGCQFIFIAQSGSTWLFRPKSWSINWSKRGHPLTTLPINFLSRRRRTYELVGPLWQCVVASRMRREKPQQAFFVNVSCLTTCWCVPILMVGLVSLLSSCSGGFFDSKLWKELWIFCPSLH